MDPTAIYTCTPDATSAEAGSRRVLILDIRFSAFEQAV